MRMSTPRTQRQSGFSIVEIAIVSALMLVLCGLVYGAVTFLHSATRYGEAKLKQEADWRAVMQQLRDELRFSTFERDPSTGTPRWSITTSGGRQVLTFRKMVGARLSGTRELESLWSGPIAVTVNPQGQVVRTENGETRILGSGVKDLQFEGLPAASPRVFKVTITTTVRDPRDQSQRDYVESFSVRPSN
jgi:hypothetical protein